MARSARRGAMARSARRGAMARSARRGAMARSARRGAMARSARRGAMARSARLRRDGTECPPAAIAIISCGFFGRILEDTYLVMVRVYKLS
jgi:hypothetical protein|nr:hypothetical protein [Scytonema hyalinum WJT4-NPBG1]